MIDISFPTFSKEIKREPPFSLCCIRENKESLIQFMMALHSERYTDVLVAYNEEKATFWDKDNIRFIDSVLFVDPNDKKNLAALRKQLKKRYLVNLNESADRIASTLTKAFDEIKLDYDVELYSDISLKTEDILKLRDIKVNVPIGSLLERVLQYLKVSIELAGTKLFVFHHLSLYLSEYDISSIIHELNLMGGSLIDFESSSEFSDQFDKKIIFDQDFTAIE